MFDAYYEWLSIPPQEQPPSYYRLLGVQVFEDNRDVIQHAADRQMAHVRAFQSGPRVRESQSLLNEIATAQNCLLTPEKKAQYDACLRAQQNAGPVVTPPVPVGSQVTTSAAPAVAAVTAPATPTPASAPVAVDAAPMADAPPTVAPLHATAVESSPRNRQLLVIGGLVSVIAAMSGVILYLAMDGDEGSAKDRHVAARPATTNVVTTDETSATTVSVAAASPSTGDSPTGSQPPGNPPTDAALPNTSIAAVDTKPVSVAPDAAVAASTVSPANRSPFAIALAGKQRIELPAMQDAGLEKHGFTAEAWVYVRSTAPAQWLMGNYHISHDSADLPSSATQAGWALIMQTRKDGRDVPGFRVLIAAPGSRQPFSLNIRTSPPVNRFCHIALSWKPGGLVSLAVNGFIGAQVSRDVPLAVSPSPICIGCPPSGPSDGQFAGIVRQFRLSRGVRYVEKRFVPGPLTTDPETLFLLDLSAGKGTEIPNASRPDSFASLEGGRWMALPSRFPIATAARSHPAGGNAPGLRVTQQSPAGTAFTIDRDTPTPRVEQVNAGPAHTRPANVASGNAVSTNVAATNPASTNVAANVTQTNKTNATGDVTSSIRALHTSARPATNQANTHVHAASLVQFGNRSTSRSHRIPVPNDERRQAAREHIHTLMRSEFELATTAEAKKALSELLSNQARREKDSVTRYILLEEALQLAIDAEDPRQAMLAAGELNDRYEVDGAKVKAIALRKLATRLKSASRRRLVAELASEVGEHAMSAEQFNSAKELFGVAMNVARSMNETEGRVYVNSRRRKDDAEEYAQQLAQAKLGDQTLSTNPHDRRANSQIGEFLCFVRGDWSQGLPYLSRGFDTNLSDIATLDRSNPTDTAEQLTLADEWFDWSQATKLPFAAEGAMRRARDWYSRVLPQVTDLARAKVRRRLEQISEAVDLDSTRPTDTEKTLAWLNGSPGIVRRLAGHEKAVTGLDASTTGKLIASHGQDGFIRLWDTGTGAKRLELSTSFNGGDVCLTGDESRVIGPTNPNLLMMWDAKSGAEAGRLNAEGVTDLALSLDGKRLAWAADNQSVTIWDLPKGRRHIGLTLGETPVAVALSANEGEVMVGVLKHVIDVAVPSARTRRETPHAGPIKAVCYSTDGQTLVSCSATDVKVWDVGQGQLRQAFSGLRDVTCLAVTGDGSRVAVNAPETGVIVLDTVTGKATALTDRGESGVVTRVAFLPDPRGLATGARDGSVRIWRLP